MAGPSDKIEISWQLMTSGDYVRQGDHLKITHEDLFGERAEILLKDYFVNPKDLVTPNGSILKSHIVDLMAVNSRPLDQSLVAFEDPDAIGEITIAGGTVTVQRAGQTIELQVGDLIYLNDVIESTGGSTGIVFLDDTTFSIDAGARQVIDDFVYDPETLTGSMNVTMIKGDFSFISGGVAKTGADAMKVTTPVLTIGVRGTQVAGKASQEGESNDVVLLPNEDGTVGEVALITQGGEVVLTQPFESSTITSAFLPPSIPIIVPEDVVLKKFAKTIATNKTTLKTSQKNKKSKEAEKQKKKLEEEQEQLEEEKEQLEEEKEQLEEEAEQLEEEAELLEEELEEVAEKEKEVEIKEEKLEEAKVELEEKLEQAAPQEKAKIEEELAKVEEEIVEVEQIREEIIEEKIQFEEKIQEVEQVVQKIEQRFQEVEQKFEQVFVLEQNIEQNFQQIEQEIQQIEQEFQQFFQELEQDFGAEVINEVEKAFNEADVVFEDKIEEQVIQEIKEEPKVEEEVNADIFEEDADMPEEDMEQIQKIEEELRLEEEAFKDQIEADFDQAKEDGELLDAPKEVQDIFNEADNFQEFEQEMENLMQEDAFQQEMQAQDDIFQQEEMFVEEQFKMDDFKQEDEQLVAFEQPVYQEEIFIDDLDNVWWNEGADEIQDDFQNFENFMNGQDLVLFVNTAPTISTIANVSKSESLSVGSTIATASASDADGDALTYSLTVDQSGNLAINDNGVITLASSFTDVTEDTNYNVTVRAFDGTDDAKADFVLTVTADGSITIHENILDFEDVHSGNDGTPIAYKQNVGYYTMDLYQGDTTNQKRIIENTGHTATNLTDVRTADLQNIDIMYVHNGDNSRYLSEWLTGVGMADSSSPSSASSDVWSWVNDGGILLIQDRHVTNANNMLLGESATITRSFGGYDHGIGGTNDDTDFRTELNDTLLYNGAAGTLTNNTLDGGGHTDHGHITNLGTGEVGIGHRGINDYPNGESYNNAFAYKYGSGLVYYDTYPMDLWDGSGVESTYTSSSTLSSGGSQTYNENLIQWAASLYYDGASQINGTSGADTILGTMGDDVIYGGGAADTLWGGEGADTFKYEATTDSNTTTVDTILDFNASDDSIDISDITNSVTKVISGTQLQLDTNGDSTTDMYINLTGFTGTVDDITVVT